MSSLLEGKDYVFTSESVTEGHPDKVCDQISDGVLDAVLAQDPMGRVACETFVTMGLVIVGGEITTKAKIDVHDIVRKVVNEIGYNHPKFGFDYETCAILNAIHAQSPDISQGVDTGGAGDQGLMVGYACDETPELMPLPIMLAHKLALKLADVRKKNILDYLGPDGKSQVTVEYRNGKPFRVDTVVLSTQHTEDILDKTGRKITDKSRKEMIDVIVKPIVGKWCDSKTKYHINPTGKFVVGGPQSDTGMTGRKIIVDTYGGMAPHGGGAFSGKDPTKVDRSACYMARHVAKNIVAAGLAEKCTVQLAYAIGVAEPVSVMVDTHNTGKVSEKELTRLAYKHFPLTPKGIIEYLKLRRPVYRKTASYGHFGRKGDGFVWENTNKAAILKKEAGI
ncbi:MAG TPA: methionine adenosyltransferase [Elusimicrobia bacterium]|nr:MAG: methionine adenosyltransferase [Elusimicrobia bacterium RIFOXYA12_FULL_49_49]OGS16752.1 MAG: methionine adenosyltransferase [Elusimicrobia bacterium RIFOXYA2_FULL_47_53]OGS27033.1 MAG: methionine adenosyltransferase [Elusimicrobia bacterium RIFOXYB12_FULL_50_12]OGS31980.1 MAG: methionine adenosyltransferase [Elusimicrobia bacterium RIFOXYB2_FULL_46_23]HBU69832.1 methionine adenosyltransferase [Elusimicrobiota bacterium]